MWLAVVALAPMLWTLSARQGADSAVDSRADEPFSKRLGTAPLYILNGGSSMPIPRDVASSHSASSERATPAQDHGSHRRDPNASTWAGRPGRAGCVNHNTAPPLWDGPRSAMSAKGPRRPGAVIHTTITPPRDTMFKTIIATLLALFAAAAFAAVDANKATQAELEAVKGIGPAIAGKILDERKKGAFKNWDDMVERVKGVGEGNAAKFSAAGLTVGGAAYGGAPAAAPAKKDDKPAAKAEAPKAAAPAVAAAPAAKVEAKAEAKAMSADDKKADKAAAKKEGKDAKPAAAAASVPAKK